MLFQNKKDIYQLCLVAVEAEEAIKYTSRQYNADQHISLYSVV